MSAKTQEDIDPNKHKKSAWAVARAITKFQNGHKKNYQLHRDRRGSQWVSGNPDSFIAKYTTQRRRSSDTVKYDEIDMTTLNDHYDKDGQNVNGLTRFELVCERLVVNPDGAFLFWWLVPVIIAITYNAWFSIARSAWPDLDEAYRRLWLAADLVCDLVYVADILVQVRTAYMKHGLLVHNGRLIAKHYINSREFVMDLLSTIPIDFCYAIIKRPYLPYLRLTRLIKFYRARQFAFKVEAASSRPNVWRILHFLHFLFLINHIVAAIYFSCSTAEMVDHPSDMATNDSFQQYLEVFYWSTITLTTIGDVDWPETTPQYIIQILGFLLGIFGFATVVGQVGVVINQRNAKRMEYEGQVDNAKKYMREHEVPKGLQQSILGWYQYSWARGKSVRKQDVDSFEMLPTKLRTELAIHVSFFHECEPEFLHDLVLRMQLVVTTPGELVCRKGEIAREMFIISDGLLEVLGDDDTVVRTLQAGDFFGEVGLLMMESGSNRRTADVRSLGYSDLFVVTKEDTLALLDDYPKAEKALKGRANVYILQDRFRHDANWNPSEKDKTKNESAKRYKDRMRRSLIVRSPSTYNIEKRATYSFATTSFRRKWLDSHDSKATSRPAADTRMRTDLIDDDIARDLMTSIEGIVSEKLRLSTPYGSEGITFKLGDSDGEERRPQQD
ncbi:putative cyclic nucleotide-gated channel cone photoreceptor subunit alpha-like [Apostichopus japonicus]|uniref:Putative cyclic nucleotide-gated channel cone photoreceptor subunit alpha-like n=1 Tax=Stichopus japonicus TaxID=307972 RepID=A0A2G8K2X6_STIJA|nr:putative cyclic nucleotide-gated channel cone photoreceptor subunit alpha-like [Apostichopus japonicus]